MDVVVALIAFVVVAGWAWRAFSPPEASRELVAAVRAGAVVVDVRMPSEFERDAVPGAINVPVDQLGRQRHALDPTRPVVVYCASGARSAMATRRLRDAGFLHVVDAGPRDAWPDDLMPRAEVPGAPPH